MKRVILSIILFIFAGVMGLAVFCPLASFQKVAVSTGESVEDLGQNATTLYFVESIFVNDDDMEKAKQNLIAKDIELASSELSINDREFCKSGEFVNYIFGSRFKFAKSNENCFRFNFCLFH